MRLIGVILNLIGINKRSLGFYRYLLPYWKKELFIILLSCAVLITNLINPYLTKLIIDKAYANKDLKLFFILVGTGAVIFVLGGVMGGVSDYFRRAIRFRISLDLNRKVFRKLQGLPYSFFQDSSAGDHLYKIRYDIDQVVNFVADVLPDIVILGLRSIFILIIVFYLNLKMALFSLAIFPFLYPVSFYFLQKLRKAIIVWVEDSQAFFSRLQESLAHMHLIKALGQETHETRSYMGSLIKNIRLGLKNAQLEIKGAFIYRLVNRIIGGLIIFFGGYQVIKGTLTLGSLTAITIYFGQLLGLQHSATGLFQAISLGSVSCERIDRILRQKTSMPDEGSNRNIALSCGTIEFRDVTFGYAAGKKVLEDLSFSIAGGSAVTLVGTSGCGKTTLINLILKLYQPQSGQIFIDGYDIAHVKTRSLCAQMGVVLQEPYLWNTSITDNIKYGNNGAGLNDIEEAARIACIDSFINKLPDKYQTVIGENACRISDGQKQRLAIARAVVKRPRILIFDEALSSVEVEIEERIIANIRKALKDSTVIIISHRPSTIKSLDWVCFLEGPHKIDIAKHDTLLAQNAQYYNYFACH